MKYVEDAVRQGAELVVFPECMDTGYLFDSVEHCRSLAETMTDGPFARALSALSKKHSIYIASGVTEWDPEKEKIFNSGIMFGRRGEIVCHYHKQFLATHDQNWFAFGERGCPVVDTDLGKIGLLICFDGRIPEIFRSMALQGAEVIVDMANFFSMDQADMWGPARSYENGVWLVAATKAGYERSIYHPGGSKIADRRPETYGIMALPYAKTPVCGIADTPLVPSKSVTKVAAVQMHVSADSTASDVLDMVDHTAKLGVKVLTLPEYAFSPNCILSKDEANALADQASGLLSKLGTIAAKYECLIAFPTVERAATGLLVTTYLIGPDGHKIGHYRKTHLTAEERV